MSVWEERDLPLLRALATSDDENLRHGHLTLWGDDATPLDLPFDVDELHDAILTLGDAGYVEGEAEYSTGAGAMFTHFRVTGRGLQALGQWPGFIDVSPLTMGSPRQARRRGADSGSSGRTRVAPPRSSAR